MNAIESASERKSVMSFTSRIKALCLSRALWWAMVRRFCQHIQRMRLRTPYVG